MSQEKLTGYAAIEAAKRHPSIVLCKHTDPTEEAREGLTVEEAEEIAREDDGLIWAEIPATLYRKRGYRLKIKAEDVDTRDPACIAAFAWDRVKYWESRPVKGPDEWDNGNQSGRADAFREIVGLVSGRNLIATTDNDADIDQWIIEVLPAGCALKARLERDGWK